jgi:hypothetical protein
VASIPFEQECWNVFLHASFVGVKGWPRLRFHLEIKKSFVDFIVRIAIMWSFLP